MGFFTRLLQIRRRTRSQGATPWEPEDNGSELVLDAEAAEQLAIEMGIDACIASHRTWHAQWDSILRGAPPAQHPELLCEEHPCEVARWLSGPGQARYGSQKAFGMLAARHRYFHQQVAAAIAHLHAGETAQSLKTVSGGCTHASNQVVLLLRELRKVPVG